MDLEHPRIDAAITGDVCGLLRGTYSREARNSTKENGKGDLSMGMLSASCMGILRTKEG